MSQSFKGVYTALVTPFLDNLQIDWESFDKLLADQKSAGIHGVIICGTTGEAPTLSVQEKLSLIRRARAQLPADMRVIAGTGSNNTAQSIELSRLAADGGADALLVVTPPYNKPTIKGLLKHFAAISASVSIPLVLYHVPARTGQRLDAEQISSLCEIERVDAIKEASADLSLFSQIRLATKKCLLSGDDFTFLASLAVGGEGVISVVTNVFPKAFVVMYEAFQAGDHQRASAIHLALLPFVEALFCEANPGPAKAALSLRGLCQNYLRLPLTEVESENWQRIEKIFQQTSRSLEALGL